MIKPRILIAETQGFSPDVVALLQQFGEVDLIDIQRDTVKKAFSEYDVFWFRLGFSIGTLEIPENPRCRFIVCPATGLDHINEVACGKNGITVLSLRGETDFLQTVRATAELTIGLALALLRKIPAAIQHVQQGDWDRDQLKGQELQGKTVGIAGMGRLGKITAQYFSVFGCKVLGYDRQPFEEANVESCPTLESLVAQSDIVSIHINYSPETHHLFDNALFSRFKKGSFLLNTARGGLVDSAALAKNLENGQLAGAALDVLENEYEHQRSPLIKYAQRHENLLITPHIGGNTKESFAKTEMYMALKLRSYLEHKNV